MSDTQRSPRYDLVVFGATGFTGQYVVEEVGRVAAKRDGDFTWAVAGRNGEKLKDLLERVCVSIGQPHAKNSVGLLICDVGDEESLVTMCQNAKVVLNCVGPYRFYGEPVVKACVENGCSCVDLCGEPQFLEEMQLKYSKAAEENSVYIVGSCGFDSIPADLGVLYTRHQFPGILSGVESYLVIETGPQGGAAHYATWQSAIYGFADQDKLRKLRKEMNQKPLPVVGRKLPKRGAVFYSKDSSRWAFPFPGSDASVVRRSQRYLHEELGESPVQYAAYATVPGFGSLLLTIVAGFFFGVLAKFRFGRSLLEKYPRLFSLGVFSHEGPSEAQMKGTSFKMTLFAQGYSQGRDPQSEKPDVRMTTRVSGPEPGYVSTSMLLVQAGLTILKEHNALPTRGGVYTPAAAFGRTSLVERLCECGVAFSVVEEAGDKKSA